MRTTSAWGGDEEKSGAGVDTAWRGGSYPTSTSSYTRAGQGHEDGAMSVSCFPPDTTQEELSEALAQFGEGKRMVMRVFPLSSSPLIGFSERTYHHRTRFKKRVFSVVSGNYCAFN